MFPSLCILYLNEVILLGAKLHCFLSLFMKPVLTPMLSLLCCQSCTVKPCFTDTHLMWTPHHCGQFASSLGKESSLNIIIFSKCNPLNTDTPLIWTISMVPTVPVLMGFDCTCFENGISFSLEYENRKVEFRFCFCPTLNELTTLRAVNKGRQLAKTAGQLAILSQLLPSPSTITADKIIK